jgi:hypothetical protein
MLLCGWGPSDASTSSSSKAYHPCDGDGSEKTTREAVWCCDYYPCRSSWRWGAFVVVLLSVSGICSDDTSMRIDRMFAQIQDRQLGLGQAWFFSFCSLLSIYGNLHLPAPQHVSAIGRRLSQVRSGKKARDRWTLVAPLKNESSCWTASCRAPVPLYSRHGRCRDTIEETFACLRTRMVDGTGCEDPLLGFLLVASSLGCLLLRFLI